MGDKSRTASTTIAAPPATVFAILSDPRQHPRIDGSGNVKGSISGPDSLELGSEFGMDMKQGASYKIKNTVVEFEQDRLIAWRHMSPHRWRYELSPTADGGTAVTETWDLSHCNPLMRAGPQRPLRRQDPEGARGRPWSSSRPPPRPTPPEPGGPSGRRVTGIERVAQPSVGSAFQSHSESSRARHLGLAGGRGEGLQRVEERRPHLGRHPPRDLAELAAAPACVTRSTRSWPSGVRLEQHLATVVGVRVARDEPGRTSRSTIRCAVEELTPSRPARRTRLS